MATGPPNLQKTTADPELEKVVMFSKFMVGSEGSEVLRTSFVFNNTMANQR